MSASGQDAVDPDLEAFVGLVRAGCADLPRPLRGLEMFARDGSWFTRHLAGLVDEMECWEINSAYLPDLKRNIPGALVRQVDSIAEAGRTNHRFGLVSLDNPQGVYGDYCEHFEALARAARIVADQAVLVFNINVRPYRAKVSAAKDDYGMTTLDTWFERRAAFYGRPAEALDLDFVADFYRGRLEGWGLTMRAFRGVLFPSAVAGHPDYLYRVAASVEREAP